MNGFIKLERKIFDWEWYTEQDTFRMFIHLLLKANHKKASVNGKIIERGQTLTSIPRLSDELSMLMLLLLVGGFLGGGGGGGGADA